MRKRARSLQKLLHMIPTTIPIAATISVSTIYSHSGQTTQHNKMHWTCITTQFMLTRLLTYLKTKKSSQNEQDSCIKKPDRDKSHRSRSQSTKALRLQHLYFLYRIVDEQIIRGLYQCLKIAYPCCI